VPPIGAQICPRWGAIADSHFLPSGSTPFSITESERLKEKEMPQGFHTAFLLMQSLEAPKEEGNQKILAPHRASKIVTLLLAGTAISHDLRYRGN